MAQSNIHAAKTNLSKLIERALAGEEVIIAKAGKPLVRLQPLEPQVQDAPPKRRILGALAGQGFWIGPDFDAADAEILRDFEESGAPWEDEEPR